MKMPRFGQMYHIRARSPKETGECKALLREKAKEQNLPITLQDNALLTDRIDVFTREHAWLGEVPKLGMEDYHRRVSELKEDKALWLQTAKASLMEEHKPQLEAALKSGDPDAILKASHALDYAFTQTRDHYEALYAQNVEGLSHLTEEHQRNEWVRMMVDALYAGTYSFPGKHDPDTGSVIQGIQNGTFNIETGQFDETGLLGKLHRANRLIRGMFPDIF